MSAPANNMRAQASSLYLFVNNLVGIGLGPTAVALLADSFEPWHSAEGYESVSDAHRRDIIRRVVEDGKKRGFAIDIDSDRPGNFV